MVLIGYLAFLDPPKESTADAIQALKNHGVLTKILTGDNEKVTRTICKQVGLKVRNMLLGSDLEHMNDAELARAAETTDVFAKLTPEQKARIVSVLRENGHTVGFMGDGINDAAAMKSADIGISVDTAVDVADVPEQFYISDEKLPDWRYLKGSKREERTNKKTGFTYTYSEGAMSFPDATDKPSRTILTGEGGTGASRFKHVIECPDGRFRRLVPDELDQLQGFPKGWTDTGMTDGHRAFCMGNALVTGVPHRIGEAMVEVYGL